MNNCVHARTLTLKSAPLRPDDRAQLSGKPENVAKKAAKDKIIEIYNMVFERGHHETSLLTMAGLRFVRLRWRATSASSQRRAKCSATCRSRLRTRRSRTRSSPHTTQSETKAGVVMNQMTI